jgi:cbb3-type cytochrome oxidase cytochrome c subunit/uncharacterized protein YlxW (UPF0749 family)
MPKRDIDHAYDINRLNMFFALSSVLLFAFFAWMLWADFDRDWKSYQAKFRRLDRNRTEALEGQEIAALRSNPEYVKVYTELQSAQAQLNQHRKDYQKALDQQRGVQGEWYKADQKFRFKKAEFEARRYEYEESVAVHGKEGAKKEEEKLKDTQTELDHLSAELDKVNAKKAAIDGSVEKYTKQIDDLEKQKSKLTTKLDRLARKRQGLIPSIAGVFRNLPLVDFIGPSIKIQQVVVDNIYEDLNFTRVPRVDRCMTCHASIAQEGYEAGTDIPNYGKIEQPFVSHPNFKLFVGTDSKHPMETFGCTGCHLGRGRSTDFVGAVHVPADEKEKKRWEEDLHWHKMQHWEYPMYTREMVEASCVKCHQGAAQIPEGKKINVARYLFIENGCHGCHLTKGFENLPKIGPNLEHISSKVTKDWAFKWIKNPHAFRPTTRMPRYFLNSNNSSPEDIARNDVEVRSIVEYLFSKSKPIDYQPIQLSGDPANGKKLVMEIGCVGCHLMEGEKPSKPDTRRRFGPPLIKLGSKTNAAWLFNWLREPRHYSPETRIPNMKLTYQEATDIG